MDVAVLETGNGGDLQIVGNDFASQRSWGNMPYLALFGGNIEGSTKELLATEQAQDYWANKLCYPNDPSLQFNSETERLLTQIALTSSSRLKIQKAAENDLAFMKAFSTFTVTVTIPDNDKVNLNIRVRSLDNASDEFRDYIFVWDVVKRQLGDFKIEDFNNDFFV